jgi:hypothetical protein
MHGKPLVAVAYGFAFVLSLFVALFVGLLLWSERSRPSAIALGAGGAALAAMTLAVAVVDRLVQA